MSDCGNVKKVFVPADKSDDDPVVDAAIHGIRIERIAAEKIILFLKEAKKALADHGLFIKVVNDGCSGKSYIMDLKALVDAKKDGDKIFSHKTAQVFIDKKSYLFVTGSILDYKEALTGSGFTLVNPNVKRSCSCGSSFST